MSKKRGQSRGKGNSQDIQPKSNLKRVGKTNPHNKLPAKAEKPVKNGIAFELRLLNIDHDMDVEPLKTLEETWELADELRRVVAGTRFFLGRCFRLAKKYKPWKVKGCEASDLVDWANDFHAGFGIGGKSTIYHLIGCAHVIDGLQELHKSEGLPPIDESRLKVAPIKALVKLYRAGKRKLVCKAWLAALDKCEEGKYPTEKQIIAALAELEVHAEDESGPNEGDTTDDDDQELESGNGDEDYPDNLFDDDEDEEKADVTTPESKRKAKDADKSIAEKTGAKAKQKDSSKRESSKSAKVSAMGKLDIDADSSEKKVSKCCGIYIEEELDNDLDYLVAMKDVLEITAKLVKCERLIDKVERVRDNMVEAIMEWAAHHQGNKHQAVFNVILDVARNRLKTLIEEAEANAK